MGTLQEQLKKFLYEKAKDGDLSAGFYDIHPIGHVSSPLKKYNIFDIIDKLHGRVEESSREVAEYEVMYLRKAIIEKIALDFDSWFPLSGLNMQDWQAHSVTFAKNYMII